MSDITDPTFIRRDEITYPPVRFSSTPTGRFCRWTKALPTGSVRTFKKLGGMDYDNSIQRGSGSGGGMTNESEFHGTDVNVMYLLN